MSEEVKPKDNIDSLLEAIAKADDDCRLGKLSFDQMEETVKELKMRVELVKMKETLQKIGNKKTPKSESEGNKIKSLRETLKDSKTNDIPS